MRCSLHLPEAIGATLGDAFRRVHRHSGERSIDKETEKQLNAIDAVLAGTAAPLSRFDLHGAPTQF